MYLPKDATIEQACAWLEAETGEAWILPRLMECHLTPYFWNDYRPGFPSIYGDRIEGYQTRMVFQGDFNRLESDGGFALVNMFRAHDGSLIKVEPGWRLPLSELRFKREALERVAEIINASKAVQEQPTPKAGTEKRWTPEFTATVRAYRATHTEAKTAEKFDVSGPLVRRKLKEESSPSKPKAGFFPTTKHRI